MENNETCIHGGVAPVSLLDSLHASQAGSGRHRCPTCAYEEGFLLGSSKLWKSYTSFSKEYNAHKDYEFCKHDSGTPTSILRGLGDNQGGTGRHKCTNCAFKQGFEVGLSEYTAKNISIEFVPPPKSTSSGNKKKFIDPAIINFAEREEKNRKLGNLGELFIKQREINFLNEKGRADLAKLVRHVSKEDGDGLGYDILSFDINGDEKKIEVKTTRGNILRPFYITRNEIDYSTNNPMHYYLYRVFDFDTNLNRGKCYVIKGNLAESLILDSLLYVAFPKPK